jgi:hypothetical protein
MKGVSLEATGPFAPRISTVAGTTVHYQIVVTNIGNVLLSGISLSDNRSSLVGCKVPDTLAVGVSFSCTYTAAAPHGTVTNTATATSSQAGPVSASAIVVGATRTPVLSISKGVSLSPAGPFVDRLETVAGLLANYRIVVRNAGNVPLTGITLVDSRSTLAACAIPGDLAVGAEFSCAYASVITAGSTTNTATASSIETGPTSDSAVVVGFGGEVLVETTGQLRIKKLLTTGAGFPGGQFAFHVSCLDRVVYVAVQAAAASGSLLLPDRLLAGAECTVTELGPLPAAGTGYAWAGSPVYAPGGGSAPTVVIPPAATMEVTVTNVRQSIPTTRTLPPTGSSMPPSDTIDADGSTPFRSDLALIILVLVGLVAFIAALTPRRVLRGTNRRGFG